MGFVRDSIDEDEIYRDRCCHLVLSGCFLAGTSLIMGVVERNRLCLGTWKFYSNFPNSLRNYIFIAEKHFGKSFELKELKMEESF